MYQFQPHLTLNRTAILLKGLKKRHQVCLERMRMGCATTNVILSKVGSALSDGCDACGYHHDSVIHRVEDCPALSVSREALEKSLIAIDPALRVSLPLLLDWSTRSTAMIRKMIFAFCSFLTSSGLENLFLWNPGVA